MSVLTYDRAVFKIAIDSWKVCSRRDFRSNYVGRRTCSSEHISPIIKKLKQAGEIRRNTDNNKSRPALANELMRFGAALLLPVSILKTPRVESHGSLEQHQDPIFLVYVSKLVLCILCKRCFVSLTSLLNAA